MQIVYYSNGSVGASRQNRSAESAHFSAASRIYNCQNQSFISLLFLRSGSGGQNPPPRQEVACTRVSSHVPTWTLALLCAGAALFSADRHLTQINAELGGAALLSNKERFQNIWTFTVLDASSLCTPCSCATRCNLQNDVHKLSE